MRNQACFSISVLKQQHYHSKGKLWAPNAKWNASTVSESVYSKFCYMQFILLNPRVHKLHMEILQSLKMLVSYFCVCSEND